MDQKEASKNLLEQYLLIKSIIIDFQCKIAVLEDENSKLEDLLQAHGIDVSYLDGQTLLDESSSENLSEIEVSNVEIEKQIILAQGLAAKLVYQYEKIKNKNDKYKELLSASGIDYSIIDKYEKPEGIPGNAIRQ